jgi:DNA recombination protein Rad52
MAKAAEKDPAAQTADEAQVEAEHGTNGHAGEVRPEELTQGVGPSAGASVFDENVVEELRKPLDPNRVRRRAGRGRSQFEYLAGHDVKRRANELFGFGNWGYTVKQIAEQEAVPVVKDNGTEGWHVAYMAEVEVQVRGAVPFSDVGYGDGVEYGPAARATARELALKESVTDALKRAFTGFGDQFGLILYAKDDEKKRIDSDRNAESTTAVRQENAARENVPRNITEISQRLGALLGKDEAAEWAREAIVAWAATQGEENVTAWKDLSAAKKNVLGQKLAGVVLDLEDRESETSEDLRMSTDVRKKVAEVFGKRLDGVSLTGPPWRLSPDEGGVQTRAEWVEAEQARIAAEAGAEEDIPFPGGEEPPGMSPTSDAP